MKRFLSFFKEAYEELKKVVWPSRKNVIRHTLIVLITVFVAMLLLTVVDFGLAKGVQTLLKFSQK